MLRFLFDMKIANLRFVNVLCSFIMYESVVIHSKFESFVNFFADWFEESVILIYQHELFFLKIMNRSVSFIYANHE